MVVQPGNRGTLPAILLSLLEIVRVDPHAVVAFFPSDHHYSNEANFMAGVEWEWLSTDAVPTADALEQTYAGLWIAPASPYRSMDGALGAVTAARERGIPLVGT